jgi:NADH-quinone oxidoreductase E subunit
MSEIIENVIERYSNTGRDNLIPLLQDVQDEIGYISEEAIIKIGKHLKLPTSKIYGVATFYNQFRFEPKGKYHIQICRGTACHVLGSSTVLQQLEKYMKVKAGQTTRDKMFSLEVVACLGACGLAPVVTINGEFYANADADNIKKIIDDLKTR